MSTARPWRSNRSYRGAYGGSEGVAAAQTRTESRPSPPAARPCRSRELDCVRIEIDTDHGATTGGEDADGKLTDKAEPDDADALPELSFRAANAVQGDRSHGCVCRALERDAVRDGRDEVARHGDHLGVRREPAAAASDAVA